MENQTDINDASELALMHACLKLVDDTARKRDEVTVVCEELHALAATYPTRYENVRRLTAKELDACVKIIDAVSDLCAKGTSLGAAKVAQILRDDVAGHYRRLASEEQYVEGHMSLYPTRCESCKRKIFHHHDTCDECFLEAVEFDVEDLEIFGARDEPIEIYAGGVETKFDEIKESASRYVTESIFHRLVAKYPIWLKSKIVDVRIVQTQERVWLEITKEYEQFFDSKLDQMLKRRDLAFYFDGDPEGPCFSPNNSVSDNATKFVDNFDPHSIRTDTKFFRHAARVQINSDKNLNPDYEPF